MVVLAPAELTGQNDVGILTKHTFQRGDFGLETIFDLGLFIVLVFGCTLIVALSLGS